MEFKKNEQGKFEMKPRERIWKTLQEKKKINITKLFSITKVNYLQLKQILNEMEKDGLIKIYNQNIPLNGEKEEKSIIIFIRDGYQQTEIKPYFICEGCGEEFENVSGYSFSSEDGEIILCEKCYKDLLVETNQND